MKSVGPSAFRIWPASVACDGGTAVDETLRGDFFVPKQLGALAVLGLLRLSPALMVR